jgi:tRNA (guanine9-N1)-methyltransferase
VTLDTIDHDAVYVIGGLVDRNQHVGLCHRRAQAAGVCTARLPLEEHVAMNAEGHGRALTVNQCYELLLLRAQGHGWEAAIRRVLPSRRQSSRRREALPRREGARASRKQS